MKSFKNLMKTILIIFICITVISFFQTSNAEIVEEQKVLEVQGIDDLGVSFVLNQSSIGRYSGTLGNLTLQNNLIDPITDLTVNFSLNSQYAKFSPTYSENQELSLLNPGASSSFNIETILNITKIDEENGIDVVLLFDSSGSMQDEIDSVRNEFLEITSNLEEQIPALRMGMIVYGWGEYSEYPASSVNNYVELTENITKVSDLLSEIYAGGSGVEPWGDAFAVINDWTWREEVPKLAIIIGDEDCDPGHIVGTGSTDFWYNGSQLLDVITSLKEKGVQINSVYTDDLGYVIDQFEWISSYTGGECIDLQALQESPEPIELPELIEGWTISLAREYFVDLNANISWTEPVAGEDYSVIETQQLLIDLAPPSITVSTIQNEITDDIYELEIFARPLDVSGISQINMYYTYDDLNDPFDPTWHFRIMDNELGGIYVETLSNLAGGDLVSFYVEASDTLNNYAKTIIYNLTIATSPKPFNTISEFVFTSDNSTRNLYYQFNYTRIPYYYEPSTEGFLWIESEQELVIQIDDQTNFQVDELYRDEENVVYSIRQLLVIDCFKLTLKGNTSESLIKVKWTARITVDQRSFYGEVHYLDEINRCGLFLVELTDPAPEGYFTIYQSYNNELLAKVTVFNSNFEKIVTIGMYENAVLENGHYYLWVEHIIREGSFKFHYDDFEVTTGDPYYDLGWVPQTPLPSAITLLIFNLVLFGCLIGRRRRKSKR